MQAYHRWVEPRNDVVEKQIHDGHMVLAKAKNGMVLLELASNVLRALAILASGTDHSIDRRSRWPMTQRSAPMLPSNVVLLRPRTHPVTHSSSTLWEWLMVGCIFTGCSFAAMYFLTHSMGMRAYQHLTVANLTSANRCLQISCDSFPTTTSK
jgi:drug/metabolite transporter (DMT)-like permease